MLLLALISLVLSALVTFVAYRVLKNRLSPSNEASEVVVATGRLALGARITDQDVRTVPWPEGAPLQGSFSNLGEVVGRGVVVPLAPNEPVLEAKLAPIEAGVGLSSAIPEGMRAVSVKVNEVIGVAGFVLPGTHVDVIVTGSPGELRRMDTSKVILENVLVLTSGTNLEPDANGTPQNVAVVTLLVTPEDAQKLALASADGKIQLALRNPLDMEQNNPEAVHKVALYLGESNDSSSSKPPEARAVRAVRRSSPLTVELIQGNEKKTETFSKKKQ
jgi:pilus assembly protein CpaB